ncbi:MAG: hypothetical protein ACTHLE_05010 [Agriterribacter sp.]
MASLFFFPAQEHTVIAAKNNGRDSALIIITVLTDMEADNKY